MLTAFSLWRKHHRFCFQSACVSAEMTLAENSESGSAGDRDATGEVTGEVEVTRNTERWSSLGVRGRSDAWAVCHFQSG